MTATGCRQVALIASRRGGQSSHERGTAEEAIPVSGLGVAGSIKAPFAYRDDVPFVLVPSVRSQRETVSSSLRGGWRRSRLIVRWSEPVRRRSATSQDRLQHHDVDPGRDALVEVVAARFAAGATLEFGPQPFTLFARVGDVSKRRLATARLPVSVSRIVRLSGRSRRLAPRSASEAGRVIGSDRASPRQSSWDNARRFNVRSRPELLRSERRACRRGRRLVGALRSTAGPTGIQGGMAADRSAGPERSLGVGGPARLEI